MIAVDVTAYVLSSLSWSVAGFLAGALFAEIRGGLLHWSRSRRMGR